VKHHRPPIPPLGEAAVSRIEREVFAEIDRDEPVRAPRRWPWALALAAAATAVAVFLGVRVLRPPTPQIYPSGAHIATGSTPFHVAMDGATLDLAADSAVQFGKEKDGSVVLVLDRGRVTCEVAPREGRAPFVVVAGATRVIVVGTRFSVEREGDHALVFVEHGIVQVIDGASDERVGAGESYQPHAIAAAAPVAAPAVAPAPVAPVAPAPVAPVAPASRPAPARPIAHAAPKQVEPAPVAEAPVPPAEAPVLPAAAAAPPAEAPPPPSPPPAAKTISAQERFESAVRLEATAPEAALAMYDQLASGSGAWAANALFAAARLEAQRGHSAPARRLLQTYLERFPTGVNAEDAREMLQNLR
jgi:FecR-like protein